MQSATIHIKMRPELAEALKRPSRTRETSVGELVRHAIISCYQLDLLSLSEKQRHAVEAFLGGYISLGKLAEEMGRDVWQTREWLTEHNIPENNSFAENDPENA